MAKLEINLDTETNEVSVTVNGESLDNVRCVEICNWDDGDGGTEPHFTVTTHETRDGVSRRVGLTAARTAKASDGRISDSKFPGLVEVRKATDAVSAAFAELFSRDRRR